MTTDRNEVGRTPNFAPSWKPFLFLTYFLNTFKVKLSFFQKFLFALLGFGLLFVNKNVAFVYLIVLFSIIAFLEYGQRKAK